jgi:hypothetical protein
VTDISTTNQDLSELDALTAGAFSAPTSGDRSSKLREWLLTNPSVNQLQVVFKEMSHRDKGAAKVVREKLDDIKRTQGQDAIVQEWAEKGQALCDVAKLNLADALAWQRDAAKAGAPLSREPLSLLKQALNERVKEIEDLQHQALVQREAAVLLAQRIEVLSTKQWQDALAQREAINHDVQRWQEQAQSLQNNAQWASVDAKYPPAVQTSAQQVQAVWDAFVAALTIAQTAADDAAAPLPAVPAWAEQITHVRQGGKESATTPSVTSALVAIKSAGLDSTRIKKYTADKSVIDAQRTELALKAEALFKPVAPQAAPVAEVTQPEASEIAVSEVPAADTTPAHPPVVQKWVPVVTGKKLQDSLRELREAWKKVDKEAAPNPALWKRFDTACNRAHDVVQAWLKESRAQSSAVKNQRLALIQEVKDWAAAHAQGPDWKSVGRQLHEFAQRWRESGHLSEKAYAELQPQWKTVIHAAHEPWETAQKASVARRQALIAEAQALANAPSLRVDAVKGLQQRWQQEAHTVALDRKQEQKLWDAFRLPLDQAFARKPAHREAAHPPLSSHDQAVVEASKALETASASGDATRIRQAIQALEMLLSGQTPAVVAVTPAATEATTVPASAPEASDSSVEAAASTDETPRDVAEPSATPEAEPAPVVKVPRPVVAVRGDDRPGQKRTELPSKMRDSKARDFKSREGNPRAGGKDGVARGPRLADPAFRAQRHAMEAAQHALRQLAAQAHGEVLTQLMQSWQQRDAAAVPALQALGGKLNAAQRTQWSQSLSQAPKDAPASALLRLEIASEIATPAADMAARRALQLQLLTRRNDPTPQMTWASDVAQVLSAAYDEAQARRLQSVLKVLLKR